MLAFAGFAAPAVQAVAVAGQKAVLSQRKACFENGMKLTEVQAAEKEFVGLVNAMREAVLKLSRKVVRSLQDTQHASLSQFQQEAMELETQISQAIVQQQARMLKDLGLSQQAVLEAEKQFQSECDAQVSIFYF